MSIYSISHTIKEL